MKNKKFLAAFVCTVIMGLTACGSGEGGLPDIDFSQTERVTIETESEEENSSDVQEQKEAETQMQEIRGGESDITSDDELEEKLAAYREKREEWTSVPMGNGVTGSGGKAANPEEFGFSFDASAVSSFDSRELTEAYGTAKSYVEDTLKVEITTKNTVYMCVDPRIWEIYQAEDKGVADGYEPENIFVCEYCDHGTWQYLILVREGKGSAWSVIHHGSSYME